MLKIEDVLDELIITTCGRIFKKDTGKEFKGCVDFCGYRVITLTCKGIKKTHKWHRLVLYNFNKDPNFKKLQVNHKDGNKLNNSILNLEWCTPLENIKRAWSNGIAYTTRERIDRGVKTRISKLTIEYVTNPQYKGQKPNIKKFLRLRGYNWEDFEFIATSRTKTNHALGYLKQKHKGM